MKRSTILKELAFYYETDEFDSEHDAKINAERVLTLLEKLGMRPPDVKSRIIRGEDFPFGGGCSSRCICEECEPNFIVNKWEKE